ncbi:Rod binding protein [Brevinema andersonii]|uniref:Rod binding protein n=1 Tax=Brevinema andersonii TaxID=34097 RepID=A0A1I1DN77_BREAD|nr:rod-binding protein [Brevinema andersonii]SFB75886.1 Rod binding protein [Brevinema andersonii]
MQINNLQSQIAVSHLQNHEFSQLKNKAQNSQKIKEVAQEFESLFVEQMFKEMKKTIKKTDLFNDNSSKNEIFDDMLITEYAKNASKTGSFGLAKMIEDSLTPKIPVRFY